MFQRRWLALAAAILLLGLLGVVGVWLRPWEQTEHERSVAVLPFKNLSGDKEQDYLADGITEDLTTDLARIPGVFVTSRNAAFAYKGKDVSPSEVAADLNVRYVLEGSIRRVGDNLRINAQLIDAKSGGHLWAERFDGSFADVFSLQDRVIAAVATALELRLTPNHEKQAGGTSNPAAYDAYLRGLELLSRHWSNTETDAGDLKKAIPHFEKAIALDPQYGQAYADLGWVYHEALWLWAPAMGLSWDEARDKGHEYLQKALDTPRLTAIGWRPRDQRVRAFMRRR